MNKREKNKKQISSISFKEKIEKDTLDLCSTSDNEPIEKSKRAWRRTIRKSKKILDQESKRMLKRNNFDPPVLNCYLPQSLLASLLTLAANAYRHVDLVLPITLNEILQYKLYDVIKSDIDYPHEYDISKEECDENNAIVSTHEVVWNAQQALCKEWEEREKSRTLRFSLPYPKLLFWALNKYIEDFKKNKLLKKYFDTRINSFVPLNVNALKTNICSARILLTKYRQKFGQHFAFPFLSESEQLAPEDRIWEAMWLLKKEKKIHLQDGVICLTKKFPPLYTKEPAYKTNDTNDIYAHFTMKEENKQDVIYYKNIRLKLYPQQTTILCLLIQQQGRVSTKKIFNEIKPTKDKEKSKKQKATNRYEENGNQNDDWAFEVNRKTSKRKKDFIDPKILQPALSRVNAVLKKYHIRVRNKNGYVYLSE